MVESEFFHEMIHDFTEPEYRGDARRDANLPESRGENFGLRASIPYDDGYEIGFESA